METLARTTIKKRWRPIDAEGLDSCPKLRIDKNWSVEHLKKQDFQMVGMKPSMGDMYCCPKDLSCGQRSRTVRVGSGLAGWSV